jgi:protein-disulfide isomerase
VLLLAGLVGWGIYASQRPSGPAQRPVGRAVGTGPVTVDVYLDFQCPVCKKFEEESGSTLDRLVADGRIKLVYHPLAFLDRASTTRYSTRSAGSAPCAADAGKLPAYVAELYTRQKSEGGPGLSDDEMIAAATSVGITDPAFATCVRDGKYGDWVTHETEAAVDRGVTGTPTVFVNGREVTATSQAIQSAVSAAG